MNLDQDKKQANILCLISLACELLPAILACISFSALRQIFEVNVTSEPTNDILQNILSVVCVILMITGIAILIYVRVKYPWHVFGKVLMWVYIILAVICIILLIVAMVICYATTMACAGSCTSCVEVCQDFD